MVAKKMNIDKDSFWIYRVKGGEGELETTNVRQAFFLQKYFNV